jgi:thiamine pyrophosphokinase
MGHHQGSVIVVSGGGPVPAAVHGLLPRGAPVVGADSGVDTALALGLAVDVAVGDFDSVTPEGLAAAEVAGARIIRHPEAKDATDLAIALDVAVGLLDDTPGEIVVVGAAAGRLDHLLAGLLALASPALRPHAVRAHLGPATIHVLHGPNGVGLATVPGALVTLVPVGGVAEGVTTQGLRYPLRGEALEAGTTRGVSNVAEADRARVELTGGTLLVVLPGDETTDGGTS